MQLTEKQKNCPYCHVADGKTTIPIFDGYIVNESNGRKTEITIIKDPGLPVFSPCVESPDCSTEYDNKVPRLNYCPMCGRSLKEVAQK